MIMKFEVLGTAHPTPTTHDLRIVLQGPMVLLVKPMVVCVGPIVGGFYNLVRGS